MTSSRFDSPGTARHSVWMGLLMILALMGPAWVDARADQPAGPVSLEELHRVIGPRIRDLAKLAFKASLADARNLGDELTNRQIEQQGKESKYQQAKLTREVAEIMVREYEQGDSVSDRARIEGEVRLAESDVARSKERIPEIDAVLERTKKFEPTTIYERTIVYKLEKSRRAEQLEIMKKQIELEKAQGKLKKFDAYLKPKRIRELEFEVEKARAEETTKKEKQGSFEGGIKLLEQQIERIKTRSLPDWASVLAALDEAVGLERVLQSQLEEDPPAEPKARERWDEKLASQSVKLRAALDKAEQLSADVEFDQLGGMIHELLQGPDSAPATNAER